MIFLQFFNIYFPFSFPYRIRYHRFPKQQLFKQGRGIPAALRPPRPAVSSARRKITLCVQCHDRQGAAGFTIRPPLIAICIDFYACSLPGGFFRQVLHRAAPEKVSITFRGGHGDCRRGPVSPREDQDRGGRNDRRRQSGGRWVCEDPAF